MRHFCVLLLLLFCSTSAQSGWLGPDNYEECVLEKMKGQDRSMRSTAQKACRKKFPEACYDWKKKQDQVKEQSKGIVDPYKPKPDFYDAFSMPAGCSAVLDL